MADNQGPIGAQCTLAFGQHEGLPYYRAEEDCPEYCQWLLMKYREGSIYSPRVLHFVLYLTRQLAPVEAFATAPKLPPNLDTLMEQAAFPQGETRPDLQQTLEKNDFPQGETRPDLQRAMDLAAFPQNVPARPGPITPQDLVGFGKHAHLTYEELEKREPKYCDWVLRKYEHHENMSYKMERLARYLIRDY